MNGQRCFIGGLTDESQDRQHFVRMTGGFLVDCGYGPEGHTRAVVIVRGLGALVECAIAPTHDAPPRATVGGPETPPDREKFRKAVRDLSEAKQDPAWRGVVGPIQNGGNGPQQN